MKTIKLLLFIFASLLAQNSVAQPVSQLTDEPDIGGWHVAYGNELTEQQAARGYVDSHLSLFSGDAETIAAWADFMLRQTVALMVHQDGPELADKFTQDDQQAASMFGAATINIQLLFLQNSKFRNIEKINKLKTNLLLLRKKQRYLTKLPKMPSLILLLKKSLRLSLRHQ